MAKLWQLNQVGIQFHISSQKNQVGTHCKMNNWDYFKNEFIKLGGIADNLICRDGDNGRGIFREGNNHKPRILCPQNLLTKVEDVILVSGEFRLKEESDHTPEAREFIEDYYQNFSWGESGKEEATKFLKEIHQMPEEAKIFIVNNKLWTNGSLNCELSLQLSMQRFIGSRCVSFQSESVLAPIWELVNHSPFASCFKTSGNGVETPDYPIDRTTNEMLHAYKFKASPMSIFFNYGFASNEVFAYSFPAEIKVGDRDLTIRIGGSQAGIESTDKKILFKENALAIPALPLGSISRKLPMPFFYSIAQKYGISQSKASSLIHTLQRANLHQRNKFKSLLGVNLNDTGKALVKSIDMEIDLIEASLKILNED